MQSWQEESVILFMKFKKEVEGLDAFWGFFQEHLEKLLLCDVWLLV